MKDKEKRTEELLDQIAGNFRGEVDVDRAWNKLHERIGDSKPDTRTIFFGRNRRLFLQAAASVAILAGITVAFIYILKTDLADAGVKVLSGADERNKEVLLPDGSRVWLNRNSELSYNYNDRGSGRNVRLRGEAFFDIRPDSLRPFIIDAGKASVRVVGTSFNVITENQMEEVEVFVKTGRVLLSGSGAGDQILINPGYIGTSGGVSSVVRQNTNANYLSWKTDTLVYEGESLNVVFSDLKKVFNINIEADDPSVGNMSLSTTFFSLPHDTIIQLICNTFTLSYRKDGNVYYLSK